METTAYGVLALCHDNMPYSLPLTFVKKGDNIYFHGAMKGKKIDILHVNRYASFSIVKTYSLIPSYFSSDDGLACPATQFFTSIIMDGKIVFVEDYEEKIQALSALMDKLQPEGNYLPLDEAQYQNVLHRTVVYKLEIETLNAKSKFGQHLSKKRFDMIIQHLRTRSDHIDIETVARMQEYRNGV